MMQIPNEKFISGIHHWQKEVFTEFDRMLFAKGRKRFFMLKWHRRARKTSLLLNILIRECLRNPNSVYPYVGPTYRQAKNIVWRDPNMLFSYLPDRQLCPWEKNESELFIKFPNSSILPIKGGDDPDSLRGLDAAGVGFDEWDDMKEIVWTQIFRPIITQDPKRWAIFTYTPLDNHATEMWRRAQEWKDWFTSFLPASKSKLLSSDELAKARREMPTWLYDREFECSDITDEEYTLITSKALDELRNICIVFPDTKDIVSCDPDASLGGDECAIKYFKNYREVDESVFHEKDTTKIAFKIELMCRKHKCNNIIIDKVGVGKGIYDMLCACEEWNVTGFDSRNEASDKDRFLNRRAEAWWYVMEIVMDKKVFYPEDILTRQDLSSVRVKPSGRKIQLEDKKLTKSRLGRSPDRGDAYVMGIWGLQFVEPKTKKKDRWDDAFDEERKVSSMAM